jgi:hypothetical protein
MKKLPDELLGPTTRELNKKSSKNPNIIVRKCEDGYVKDDDNGGVAFGSVYRCVRGFFVFGYL